MTLQGNEVVTRRKEPTTTRTALDLAEINPIKCNARAQTSTGLVSPSNTSRAWKGTLKKKNQCRADDDDKIAPPVDEMGEKTGSNSP